MKLNKNFWAGVAVGFVLSLVAIYSFFRIYWIKEIGLKFLRWHALLWLYLFIAAIFAAISYLLYRSGKLKTSRAKNIYLAVLGLFCGIYLAEIALRLKGDLTTYSEHREGIFVNPKERAVRSWYMVSRPNETYTLAAGSDYSFLRRTNSEGLADREWSTAKDSSEIRIMTLGDSFTEGDGAPEDSSYPRLLEGLLRNEFPGVKVNVINAGRCGSDPWFEYKKLNDRLLKYKPDIVLYTNGSNDMFFDHLYYGGMERFASDSTVKNRIPQPGWLGLYEVSYVFRQVMRFAGYDNTLFSDGDHEKNMIEAIANARALSKMYSKLALKNNFRCIQLIRPDKHEVAEGNYAFQPEDLMRGTDSLPAYATYDLLAYYRDSLHINSSNVDDYFWAVDGHHNPKGYAAMAQAVVSCLRPIIKGKIK